MSKKSYGVIYARYSPGSNQNEQSIEGQVRDCQEYADKHNIKIIQIYADRHISGKESTNRPEFQRMLQDSFSKQWSTVVTWKIDRFGRNRYEIAVNKGILKKNGVNVQYAKESIPDGPEGIVLEAMLEGIAEYYSAELAQKIKRGQRESVMKGRVLNIVETFGYRKDADLHYVIDEVAAPMVVEIYKMYADGMLQKEILDTLEKRGIKNYQGKPFTLNSLKRILTNRMYIGEYTFGSTTNNECIPPIVPLDLFNQVQKIISETSRAKTAAKSKSPVDFILTDYMFCMNCKGSYRGDSGTSKTGAKHYYYKCSSNKKKSGSCSSPTFKKDWLEDFVINHTLNDVLNDDTINYLADRIVEHIGSDAIANNIQAFEHELSSVNKKMDNIMKAIEDGFYQPSMKDRIAELTEQKERLEQSIVEEKSKRIPFTKEHIVFWLESFKDIVTDETVYRKQLLRTFVNSILIDGDTMHIAYNVSGRDISIDLNTVIDGVRLHTRRVD